MYSIIIIIMSHFLYNANDSLHEYNIGVGLLGKLYNNLFFMGMVIVIIDK